ncbi:NADH dehydrogenase 1 beta subcomplex subunit 7 [Hibiscus syriacus]|uniref:NADH dehydrogenase [ubiquinone] 1 beta subcomplex subunit 7 n=1 Tax=Hibiscus syriacus TaxID=106335 RepID=A0A6A2WCF2_HIBSY|nr:NADH dehydrogenase [ubiquinone] 1 beta subcomplex subunit 7-like [Hibiscus syriacus]KAE8654731.1 NADH dehydrogenase 1 beta subcomplex subunit 7 [Hibiscus syriacus]
MTQEFCSDQRREEPEKMEVKGSSKKMIATQEEMVANKVPIPYRDHCAHLLIPLNKCRQAEFYLPWKCENERHSYEKCEYELVMERMLQMQKIREEEAKFKQAGKQGGSIPLIPKTADT